MNDEVQAAAGNAVAICGGSVIREFMNECAVLDPASVTKISTAYKRYLDYFEYSDRDVELHRALSRYRFFRLILKESEGKITDAVKRLNGRPAWCFCGIRLIEPAGD